VTARGCPVEQEADDTSLLHVWVTCSVLLPSQAFNIAYSEAMERSLIDCGDDRVQGFLLLPFALSAIVLWHISASLN
jgi:hypothetical protein